MMPLADLSIDDAIALACREVPECWHSPEWRWEDGDSFQTARWVHTEGGPLIDGPILRAIWFASAWEWLLTFGDGDPLYRVVSFTDGWGVDSATYLGGGLESTSSVIVRLPTKYHALVAAVLLAAGKVVP